LKQYCKDCDISKYCENDPAECPLAKEYKQIADFEKAKEQIKTELGKSVVKMLACFERAMQRINKRLKGGD
jgi:hypothetical protein